MTQFHPAFAARCEAQGRSAESVAEQVRAAHWRGTDLWAAASTDEERFAKLDAAAKAVETKCLAAATRYAAHAFGPPTFRKLSDQRIRKIVDRRLVAWLDAHDPASGALLLGKTGVGKSMSAFALARRVFIDRALDWQRDRRATIELPEHGQPSLDFGICWASAPKLAEAGRWSAFRNGLPQALHDAQTAPLLLLDDLAWEAADVGVCRDVLHARADAGLPTIVTSGETEEVLARRYGAAVLRRVIETAERRGALVKIFN